MNPPVPAAGHSAANEPFGRRLARNVAVTIVGRSVSIVAWLAVMPAVLRALGAEAFGFWSLVSTFAGLSMTLDLGISSAVTKYVAEYRASGREERLARILALALAVSAALGGAWLIATWGFGARLLDFAKVSPGMRPEAGAMLVWMGAAFALNLLSLVLSAAIAGLQRIDLASRNLLAVTVLQLALIIAVLARGGGLVGLAIAATVAAAGSVALAWFTLRSLWPGLRLSFAGAGAEGDHAFGRFSLALQIISLGVLALYQMPKLFFTHALSLDAVGDYELGWRVAFSAWSIPTLLLPPLLPAAAHLQATGDRVRLRELYRRSSRYLFAVALPLAAALVALAGPLFTAWLGPGHARAAQANMAIAALLGINVLTSAGCLIARGIGRPWFEAGYLSIAALVQFALAAWWVPAHGFQGGLLAMFVAGVAGTLWFLVVFHRALDEPLAPFLWRNAAWPAAAATLGGAAAWLVAGEMGSDPGAWSRAHAATAAASGGAVLGGVALGVLFLSRFLTPDEMRDLWRMVAARAGAPGQAP